MALLTASASATAASAPHSGFHRIASGRTTVIIDAAGKVQKIFPKVKVEGHAEEVLAELK